MSEELLRILFRLSEVLLTRSVFRFLPIALLWEMGCCIQDGVFRPDTRLWLNRKDILLLLSMLKSRSGPIYYPKILHLRLCKERRVPGGPTGDGSGSEEQLLAIDKMINAIQTM